MKLNFKTIIVIFLIAMLGAACGTTGIYAVTKLVEKNANKNKPVEVSSSHEGITHSVDYSTIERSDYTEAISKAYDTVVEITCTVEQNSGYIFSSGQSQCKGSGVIITEDGYIVTNHHVVENATDVTIKLSNGKEYPGQVIGSDSRTDIAVVKIEETGLKYSEFADSDMLQLGQDVIAIGNSLGLGIACSNGIISALEKEIYLNNVYMTLMQTNAEVNEGNSGGGLFDLHGNIVGIVNSKKSNNSYDSVTIEGMGYAIPANLAKRIINDITEFGFVKNRATLGIRVNLNTNSYFYTNQDGVSIAEVIEGGAAQLAGLEVGDIITEINEEKISIYADVSKALDKCEIGETVKVKVLRNGNEMTFDVTLQEANS